MDQMPEEEPIEENMKRIKYSIKGKDAWTFLVSRVIVHAIDVLVVWLVYSYILLDYVDWPKIGYISWFCLVGGVKAAIRSDGVSQLFGKWITIETKKEEELGYPK